MADEPQANLALQCTAVDLPVSTGSLRAKTPCMRSIGYVIRLYGYETSNQEKLEC